MSKEKKTVTIIVEGTRHEWPKDEITYAEVVTSAPTHPQHPEITTRLNTNADMDTNLKAFCTGASVKVKEGMVFSVCETGQS